MLDSPIGKYSRFIPAALLAAYAILRIAAVSGAGPVAGGFYHDSAYTALVATEVRDGHGYINPVSWLVFLNPPDLPVPFHNANPGYLTLIAAVSYVSGMDVFRAGFLISALSNVLLAAAVYWLVLPLCGSRGFAVFCAAFTALFPAQVNDSLAYLPDALSTALTMVCFALLVRGRYLWAGILFGLVWLCRSTAALSLPGIAVYLFWKFGRRRASLALAGFGVAALLVASPWLIHTARVWGSPFRSDSKYYVFQNYFANRFTHGDVDQYWRSLTPPPSLAEVLRTDTAGLIKHTLRGIPTLLYSTLYWWTNASKPVALLLVVLLGVAAAKSWRALLTAEGAGAAAVCLATFGVLSVRAQSLEIRYLGPCTALIFLWALASLLPWFRRGFTRPERSEILALCAAGLLFLAAWPIQDWASLRAMRGVQPAAVAKRELLTEVNERFTQGARVLAYAPYFYTLFTGAPALSIPYAGKGELIAYMHRYRAPFLLLEKSSNELSAAQLAPELRVRADLGGQLLLETGAAQ